MAYPQGILSQPLHSHRPNPTQHTTSPNMPAHTNTNPTTPTRLQPNPSTPLRPQPNYTTPTRPNSTTPSRRQPNYTNPTMPNYTTPTPTRPPACLRTGTPTPPPPLHPLPHLPLSQPPILPRQPPPAHPVPPAPRAQRRPRHRRGLHLPPAPAPLAVQHVRLPPAAHRARDRVFAWDRH